MSVSAQCPTTGARAFTEGGELMGSFWSQWQSRVARLEVGLINQERGAFRRSLRLEVDFISLALGQGRFFRPIMEKYYEDWEQPSLPSPRGGKTCTQSQGCVCLQDTSHTRSEQDSVQIQGQRRHHSFPCPGGYLLSTPI